MEYEFIKGNLFKAPSHYYLVHCISSNCKMGQGIAVQFNTKFKLRDKLLNKYTDKERKHPTVILEAGVFNLITKKNHFDKPTYDSLERTLWDLKAICKHEKIKYLAMPTIGCGKDKLNWKKVQKMIKYVFYDMDIHIKVYSIE